MALLVRLRHDLLRSSSIPKCCSVSRIASDSSHLINLSNPPFSAASRLVNPSIRPTPSKHDRPPPSTSLNRFLFRPYYRQPETKMPEDENDFPKFPKPSPEEMFGTFFQTLLQVLGSVEDAKSMEKLSDKLKKSGLEMIEQLKGACKRGKRSVEDVELIEQMSDRFKKSGLEMIKQLKDMLGFVLVLPDLDIDCENNKCKGDKCGNEVITPRLPSPLTEFEYQLSVKEKKMIDEMPEKLTKYVEILEKLKDYVEMAKATRTPAERWLSGAMSKCIEKKLAGFKEYVEMNESNMLEKSIHNKFSPGQISEYAEIVSYSEGKYGDTWKSHAFDIDNFKEMEGDLKAIRESIRIWRSFHMDNLKGLGNFWLEGRSGTQFARDLLTYRHLLRLEERTQHETHMFPSRDVSRNQPNRQTEPNQTTVRSRFK